MAVTELRRIVCQSLGMADMTDYRKILKAYMDNVGECEGVFFVGPIYESFELKGLTKEEAMALAALYDELCSEDSKACTREEYIARRKRERVGRD